MSENEITGIHNFFEENNSHQSEVAGSGRVVSHSNSWIGSQGMNRLTTSSNHADSDQRNARLPIQTPFGIGLSQFSFNQHFDTIQSNNQQLNLNELTHASTTLQGRSGQAKGDGAVLNNDRLMKRSLTNFGPQEGNFPGYGSGFPGNLEKTESTVSPVNFDFLRGHQQLSNQLTGLSQPQQRQQLGFNDLQWKQHLISIQMQEIQRQQQFQQIHLGARQHNSLNQVYGSPGQGGTNEFPTMLSGMPIANMVNYMPVELMGLQYKSPSNSHMFNPGNMNWAQRSMPMMPGMMPNGLIYSQEQGQSMHSMGYYPRQLDDSLHSSPVSNNMGSLNQYFQVQGVLSHDSTSVDLMSKLGENHTERESMQSSTFNEYHNNQCDIPNEGYSGVNFVAGRQGALGKTSFGNSFVHDMNSDTVLGSIQQSNHLTDGAQVQEFQERQQPNDWLGKSHECISTEVAPSHGVTSLDPTEEKLLFGVDEGENTSFRGSSNQVAGTYLNGYPMQNNDSIGIFPPLQCGTWSALVQEALEASSSDTGQQEEWSGLSLHKTVQQSENNLFLLSGNGKQNTVRDTENNLHISSSRSSKGFPLLNDTAASQICHSVPRSQQPFKYAIEQNDNLDNSIQSTQQLPEQNDAQFTQTYQPYNFIGNSFEERKQQLNAPNGVWAVQENQQAKHPTETLEMGPNSHRMQHSWLHQQKIPFYNMNSQLNHKTSDWGVESQSSSGKRNLKAGEICDLNQYSRSNEVNTKMPSEMSQTQGIGLVGENRDRGSFSSFGGSEPVELQTNNNQIMPGEHSYVDNFTEFMNPNSFRSHMVVNQQLLNTQPVPPSKHGVGDLLAKDKKTNQNSDPKRTGTRMEDWDQSPCYANNESSEAHGHAFNHLNTSHNSAELNESSDSLLVRNDRFHLTNVDQNLMGQSNQKNSSSRRFQFHPMGNLEINMEPANQERSKSHSQSPAHPMIRGLKNQEKGILENSNMAGNAASCNFNDAVKDCFIDSKKDSPLTDKPRLTRQNSAIPSFSAARPHYSHEMGIGFPSNIVPMPFDKANQADGSGNAEKLNTFKNISSSVIPDRVSSDGPVYPLQHSQVDPVQVSGLNLAQPSLRQPTAGSSLTTHTSAEGIHRAWSLSNTSAAVLPTIHETGQKENSDYKAAMSQNSKDAFCSNAKGSSLGVMANIRNQATSRHTQFDQSVNHLTGSKIGVDGHPKHHHSPTQSPQVGSPINQASEALFPSMSGKVSDSRIASFSDVGSGIKSQFNPGEDDTSEMINTNSVGRNTTCLHQGVETIPNEPSTQPITSQQGHYSTIFNNVWRNASSHRRSNLQPQKFATNLIQSMDHLHPPQQDDQLPRKEEHSSGAAIFSTKSQHSTSGEGNSVKDPNSEEKHDNTKGRHAEKHGEKANTTVLPSNNYIQKHNHSLLQQLETMKGTYSDPSNIVCKRLKVTDSGYKELNTGSSPGDLKMLSFSSREIEERNNNASNCLIHGELASFRPTSSPGLHELQNSSLSSSVLNLTGGNELRQISSQMAPSWFEQYETCKDGQTSGKSDSLGSSQRCPKPAAQNILFSKSLEQLDNDMMLKRSGDNISENSSPTTAPADSHSSHQKLMITHESSVPGRKKRKVARSNLLPWHKEVTQSLQSLQSFSSVKLNWAEATNRLIEKVEDDPENIDGFPSIIRSRKRLILTTQLIQLLFPPVQAKLLREDSMISYEKVIYYLTKLTLGEACRMISTLGCNSGLRFESKNMVLEKPSDAREEFFSNIGENFIMRFRKIQNNFSRLSGGSSIVDYRMECQDVERVSIINRFAKFHGRGPTDVAIEGSSALETTPRRLFPQRNVSVLPMPRNIPDSVICFSL